ncbi:acyl-CoA dehydrogenase family protein [Streptomyces sp. Isolate_219]|uniref:acyl-CoA dehydrogenase family protein n=1 Tax=Streptomyces sp. Isolate_219 TaxID=2950110 RepID=UPI0021CADDFD|nr:acyl-CoA dehydrogenase family protein [Streptomyces sp. Isolate_219]MCR8572698.1 acyl-CoA dehydrogenase family protein [Streptomyces sp. Isolate_219]
MRTPTRSVPSAGGPLSTPAPDAADRTGPATTPEKSPAQPTSPQVKHGTDEEIWRRVTREVADDLAVDALVRDRAGKPPFDELARLREAGLPALLTPPGPARRGTDWRTACAVIREISAADGSIGELLGRHYVLSWSARFFGTPERADGLERRASAEQWLWGGGIDLPDTEPATGPDLTLTPAEGGYLLNGCQSFAAGVTVADRLVLGAVCTATGESLVVCADPAHPGVAADPEHDRLGQRLSAAGRISFDGVPVPEDQVLGAVPHDEHALAPFTTLAPLALRLALVHVSLGIAEGALAEARDITRAAPRSRPVTGRDDGTYPDRPGADPYLLLAYGELVTDAHTAAAVVESASEALARGLLAGPELGVDQRAEIAVLVAAAEAVTSRSAMHLTTRILELTQGADSAADPLGFDRFWRNTRVLTAQASPAHGLRDIGDHYLNGTHPALTLHA